MMRDFGLPPPPFDELARKLAARSEAARRARESENVSTGANNAADETPLPAIEKLSVWGPPTRTPSPPQSSSGVAQPHSAARGVGEGGSQGSSSQSDSPEAKGEEDLEVRVSVWSTGPAKDKDAGSGR